MAYSWSGFARARARASWGLLLTLLILVTVTTAIIAGTLGYSQAAASTSAQQALAQGEPAESGVQVQTRLAPDPARQDDLAREVITQAFAPAPVNIGRMVVSEPRPTQLAGTTLDEPLVLIGGPDLAPGGTPPTDLVTVVEGTWPQAITANGTGDGASPDTSDDDTRDDDTTPAPGALHVGAAQAWGVGVGDVLVVDDRAIEVTATWAPTDTQDAFWFGDELIRSGVLDEDGIVGPLVTDAELISQIGSPFVRWPVRPEAAAITPDDLSVLAEGAETLRADLREIDGLTIRGVQVEGDLAPTAALAADNLAISRALGVVPFSVLILVTGLAVAQLARLLAAIREPQAVLLVARGASRRHVLLTGLGESVLVALLGATLGTATAWGLLQFVPGSDGAGPRIVSAGALTLVGIAAALTAVSIVQTVRLFTLSAGALASGRARTATALATVALVLGAAALSWWQLRSSGSPLARDTDGTLRTDLLAGAAPALLLAAAAVLALALLGPLSRAVELATRPLRGAGGHLASAQVSRHLPVYAVPVVLTVLAVGSTTLAGLYAGSSTQLRDDLALVREGAPLRADLARPVATTTPGAVPPPPPDVAQLEQIDAATLIWDEPSARIGDVVVPLRLADTTALAGVAHSPTTAPQGLVPGGLALAQTADGEPVDLRGQGIGIPAAAREITVDLGIERSADRWEVARLESIEDSARQVEQVLEDQPSDQALPPGVEPAEESTLEERVAARVRAGAEATAAAQRISVALTLQEVTTGMTSVVTSEALEADGPRITIDPEDLSEITAEPVSTEGTLEFALPEDGQFTLLGITLDRSETAGESTEAFLIPPVTDLTAVFSVNADGQDLLAQDAASSWGSEAATTPEAAAPSIAEAEAIEEPIRRTVLEVTEDRNGESMIQTFFEDNQVRVPAYLDTDGGTGAWRLVAPGTSGSDEVFIGPGLTYQAASGPVAGEPEAPEGTDPGAHEGEAGGAEAVVGGRSATLPVALSQEAAAAAALEVGDAMSVTISGTRIPGRVADIVPALPGQRGGTAALADAQVVGQLLAQQQRTLNWPSQVWARPATDEAATDEAATDAALAALTARDDLRAVTGPAGVPVTDATSAARLVFWVAAAGAVLLALAGVAAVAATLLSGRRPEVAVLRALGMPPAAQARSRALELGGVVVVALLIGLAAGWAVGHAVVPELAASTIRSGQVRLPAALRVEWFGSLALLTAALAGLLGISFTLAARVGRQALDADYREEIR